MVSTAVIRATLSALAGLLAATAACGTRTPLLIGEGPVADGAGGTTAPFDAGTGTGTSSGGSPGAGKDASTSVDSGGPIVVDAEAPVDARFADVESPQCQALHADVDQLRAQATACDPTSTQAQCQELAADICCLIWIDSPPPPGAVKFADAVTAYLSSCHPSCGSNPCQVAQNSHCDSTGHCAWGPKSPGH